MSEAKLPPRRLRLFLRDFRMLEAHVSLAEGSSLMQYFASRRQYVNLRGARWTNSADIVRHAALKVEQVLWAASMDNDISLTSGTISTQPREVEIQLDGGLLVRAGMTIGEGQRLSDYLESQPQFLPVRDAQLLKSGRPPKEVNVTLGDIVLNQSAVQAVWETAMQRQRTPESEHADA
ncbi:MAG TPA: hypothetical protein VGD49_05800 [Longimicrobiales bacterium]